MSTFNGKQDYAPDYASYNWIGAPADYSLTTNTDLGGDSRMCSRPELTALGARWLIDFLNRHRKLEQMVPIG